MNVDLCERRPNGSVMLRRSNCSPAPPFQALFRCMKPQNAPSAGPARVCGGRAEVMALESELEFELLRDLEQIVLMNEALETQEACEQDRQSRRRLAISIAEEERERRLAELAAIKAEELFERQHNQKAAVEAMESERERRVTLYAEAQAEQLRERRLSTEFAVQAAENERRKRMALPLAVKQVRLENQNTAMLSVDTLQTERRRMTHEASEIWRRAPSLFAVLLRPSALMRVHARSSALDSSQSCVEGSSVTAQLQLSCSSVELSSKLNGISLTPPTLPDFARHLHPSCGLHVPAQTSPTCLLAPSYAARFWPRTSPAAVALHHVIPPPSHIWTKAQRATAFAFSRLTVGQRRCAAAE
mmetsp:Transcript_23036/g.38123  ORF Transcript_23036/g.38123 Transcript_23036/m.38123 type:complete len:359 (+) Transcript_23036:39-1115(+)